MNNPFPQAANIATTFPPTAEHTALAGFRLQRLEVLNWGTFDQQIWQISPGGDNCLLTGNIGSGKSTLIDGLTTLLVPTRKLAFNKAAGAEDKERSLESYFHGFYTSQQDETSGRARSVGLRKDQHYSVLLGVFYAKGIQQWVSLAQVLWLKPGERKVRRLFIVTERALTISGDFSGFGSKVADLRKSLKKKAVETFEGFGAYQQAFSKLLGLGSDGRALELFNQTISMKSVGSVTDFVRQNMLETPDLESHIVELERNYDDLKRLHDAVVDARKKVDLLTPIDKFGEEALQAAREKQHFNDCRELAEPYIASLAVPLYQTRLAQRQQDAVKLAQELEKLSSLQQQQDSKAGELQQALQQQGGGRLQQLQQDIDRAGKERDLKQTQYQRYQQLAQALGLADTLSATIFSQNIAAAKLQVDNFSAGLTALETQTDELKQQLRTQQLEQQQLATELSALNKRQSNIPSRQLQIREQLCQALDIAESTLPFVGELLQVKPNEVRWQGAVERVLHNFALSLLVPDELYSKVSEFIEQTHLGARLVYYRIRPQKLALPAQAAAGLLPAKLEIKADSHFYPWLSQELTQRFLYQCCDDLASFRRADKAITLAGQLKSGPERHEKDDRHQLQDKSRYVLGWSNKEKIQLLASQYSHNQQQASRWQQALDKLTAKKQQQEQLRYQALTLSNFELSFEQINYPAQIQRIAELQQEKQQFAESSTQLTLLQSAITELAAQQRDTRVQRDDTMLATGKLQEEISTVQSLLVAQQQLLGDISAAAPQLYFPTLAEMFQQYGAADKLQITMLANQLSLLRTKLNEKIQHLEEKRNKKQQQMIRAMAEFGHQFPNDVTELDQSIQALPEYQAMLHSLRQEDLPRHEARFKEMLNRDTIQAMALFRSKLDTAEEEINARIRLINQSLHGLDYQPGTFIEVDNVPSTDVEIREFKLRLKQCVENSTDDSLYSEQKFEQVKSLIEQMRQEPKWTQKVMDVRFWHLFNVNERYREDGSVKECYSDSGGKSGGQKEKLAYSILAAAILLQYRLVGDDGGQHPQQRRFNLVVIDEAFARGSKDSTRFGLELFKKLGLQLLLVTPLQKLDVIEHYVQHVHFVDQKNNRSMVLNMTIDEYRSQLAAQQQRQSYAAMLKPVAEPMQ
ncbi:hypothetical protein EOE67_15835 [Rheinheimera riviphila]|uniref:ATP-binding protein n=1 Tax=Rheinheimera riviphila TaxID=1834037 RepID=A0A437QIF7_9GAMM|nr:ATP-binding protein [Rheinheimera riviphila]RVU34337.1 hypothetical protein EOE67_15835 [Rheinheimera riviphila]